MEHTDDSACRAEMVRRALLYQTARLALEGGLGAVTEETVAEAVGVARETLLQHFPCRESLLTAVFKELLEDFDQELDARISVDPDPEGAFTRAYIGATFMVLEDATFRYHAALSVLMPGDISMRALWARWMNARLRQHIETDGAGRLSIARSAADGLWLAGFVGVDVPALDEVKQQLLAMVRA